MKRMPHVMPASRCHWLAVVLATLALCNELPGGETRPPNIFVIFTDDHGYSDLGAQGVRADLKTPHTDALAAAGVRMTSGYVTAPQCVPSRCGLLSGQYQNRLGVESNGAFQTQDGLDGFSRALTIAERLKMAGYATGMAGKWHLGPVNEISSHGFDYAFPKSGNRPTAAIVTPTGQDQALGSFQTDGYHLDACTRFACSFIECFKDRPFFFYLAYRAPHVPLDPPQKYLDRFPGPMPERRRKALAMISAMDDGVGRIAATLRRSGLEESTLLFYIGDNGAPLKIHKRDEPGSGAGWNGSLNEPLNGEKGMLTEAGVRTPFVMTWKGVIPGGREYHHPVISLDVAATAIALAALEPDPALDGVNLIPYLTGRKDQAPHQALYWRWQGQAAIRQGDWKYLEGDGRRYLFNLAADVGETRNLIGEEADRAKRMRTLLAEWSQTLKPPGLTDSLSAAGKTYFDWYLDGKRCRVTPASGTSPTNAPKKTEPAGPKTAKELFNRRDANQDGQVTLEEFLAGRNGDKRRPLERRFKALDRNRDGVWVAKEIEN